MSNKNPGRPITPDALKYGGNSRENSEHIVRRLLSQSAAQVGNAASATVRLGVVRQPGRVEAVRLVSSGQAAATETVSAVFQRVRGGTTTAISAATVIDDDVTPGSYVDGAVVQADSAVLPGDVLQMTLTVANQSGLVNVYGEVDYL